MSIMHYYNNPDAWLGDPLKHSEVHRRCEDYRARTGGALNTRFADEPCAYFTCITHCDDKLLIAVETTAITQTEITVWDGSMYETIPGPGVSWPVTNNPEIPFVLTQQGVVQVKRMHVHAGRLVFLDKHHQVIQDVMAPVTHYDGGFKIRCVSGEQVLVDDGLRPVVSWFNSMHLDKFDYRNPYSTQGIRNYITFTNETEYPATYKCKDILPKPAPPRSEDVEFFFGKPLPEWQPGDPL